MKSLNPNNNTRTQFSFKLQYIYEIFGKKIFFFGHNHK